MDLIVYWGYMTGRGYVGHIPNKLTYYGVAIATSCYHLFEEDPVAFRLLVGLAEKDHLDTFGKIQ